MKECKMSKYLSVKKVLGAKNFKRNKMIQNGTEKKKEVRSPLFTQSKFLVFGKCISIYIKQLNRDPLNVTFHASAGHITIIRSITQQ